MSVCSACRSGVHEHCDYPSRCDCKSCLEYEVNI